MINMNCWETVVVILSKLWTILNSNAMVGIGTLTLAIITFKMLCENRSFRRQQFRPYVVVSLERINLQGGLVIEAKNCGSIPARNIKVEFPSTFPRLPVHIQIQNGPVQKTLPLKTLENGLDLLTPGQKRAFPIVGGDAMVEACEKLEIEKDCRVIVTYEDDYGAKYKEHHTLDHRDTSWPLVDMRSG